MTWWLFLFLPSLVFFLEETQRSATMLSRQPTGLSIRAKAAGNRPPWLRNQCPLPFLLVQQRLSEIQHRRSPLNAAPRSKQGSLLTPWHTLSNPPFSPIKLSVINFNKAGSKMLQYKGSFRYFCIKYHYTTGVPLSTKPQENYYSKYKDSFW